MLSFLNFSVSAQNSILIKNINIWDGTSAQLTNNGSVLIEDNLIVNIARKVVAPEGTIIIDGKRKTLIPGLSDVRVHLALTMG
jgi:imidazolonepropionase-like amidohydrolase